MEGRAAPACGYGLIAAAEGMCSVTPEFANGIPLLDSYGTREATQAGVEGFSMLQPCQQAISFIHCSLESDCLAVNMVLICVFHMNGSSMLPSMLRNRSLCNSLHLIPHVKRKRSMCVASCGDKETICATEPSGTLRCIAGKGCKH